jgi:hypothetical protein
MVNAYTLSIGEIKKSTKLIHVMYVKQCKKKHYPIVSRIVLEWKTVPDTKVK